MKVVKIIVIFVMLFQHKINAQIDYFERNDYCKCSKKGIYSVNKLKEVYANATYENGRLKIVFYNGTKDKLYLFSPYFYENISATSKQIYRYNEENREIIISFLPLIPYVQVDYSDLIIGINRITRQVVYDFYKIKPSYKTTFYVKVANLRDMTIFTKDNIKLKELYTYPYSLGIDFEEVLLPENKDCIKYFIELAYYKDVSILCNRKNFYYNGLEFNEQAQSFEVLKIPLNINSNK